MASFTLSMPDDMREFVDRKTREGGFATPTEYLRSLIREDQKRDEREALRPLMEKWFLDGNLTAEEESRFPPGMLERARQRLSEMIFAASEGPAQPVTDEFWADIRAKGRAKLEQRSRKSA
jgi:antitoxin ParD1/3/4